MPVAAAAEDMVLELDRCNKNAFDLPVGSYHEACIFSRFIIGMQIRSHLAWTGAN